MNLAPTELCWQKNYSVVVWKILFLGSECKSEPHRIQESILSEDQLRAKVRAYWPPFEALQETQVSAGAGKCKNRLKRHSLEKIKNGDSWSILSKIWNNRKPVFGVDQNLWPKKGFYMTVDSNLHNGWLLVKLPNLNHHYCCDQIWRLCGDQQKG